MFVARVTHCLDSLSLLLLFEIGNELSVTVESALNGRRTDSFSWDTSLSLYLLSKGISVHRI